MPADLEINADSNIKGITQDVKGLNTELGKTDKDLDEIKKGSKGFSDNMKNAAKTFAIGSAFRAGVTAVKNDMIKTHQSSIGIVKSLKEIEFLKGKEGKQVVRGIASKLDLSIEEVSRVLGPIFSANPDRSLDELRRIGENAFIEQKASTAPAAAVAGGVSGLLNATSDFDKSGNVGAQNFLVKTAKQANLAVSKIGALAPLFATASGLGISPFEAAAALQIVTSANIGAEKAVTIINALMNQWGIYGEPQGMSFIEFVTFAIGIEDAKKKVQVLTVTGKLAAEIIGKAGATEFESQRSGFQKSGQSTVSSSVLEFNRKIKEDPAFRAEQLSDALINLEKNRDLPPERLERNVEVVGRGAQAENLAIAFLKKAFQGTSIPGAISNLLSDPLDATGNIEMIERIEGRIQNRGNTISLDNNTNAMNNLKASTDIQRTQEAP